MTRKRSLVQSQYRPPPLLLVRAPLLPQGAGLLDVFGALPARLPARRSEKAIHNGGARLNDRTELLPVDQLGHQRALVSHEPRNLFNWDPSVGQERDEGVPKLPRSPGTGVDAGRTSDRDTEVAADISGIERCPDPRGEYEPHLDPLLAGQQPRPILSLAMCRQHLDPASGQSEGPSGEPRLGVSGDTDGSLDGHEGWDRRNVAGSAGQVDVIPEQSA